MNRKDSLVGSNESIAHLSHYPKTCSKPSPSAAALRALLVVMSISRVLVISLAVDLLFEDMSAGQSMPAHLSHTTVVATSNLAQFVHGSPPPLKFLSEVAC